MIEIIDALKSKKIVIVGDLILDRYIWGDVDRISPEAPVPILEVTRETIRFGGAANVAHNVASLGGKVDLIGVVGDDPNGEKLIQMLDDAEIDTSGIVVDRDRPTSTKTRVIAHHQQIVRIDHEHKTKVSEPIYQKLIQISQRKLTRSSATIFADYDKGVVSADLIRQILKCVTTSPQPIVVDPKVENFWNYKGVTSITPNQKEASNAVGREIFDEKSMISVGREIVERLELESLLITRGENGMALFQSNDREPEKIEVQLIPTETREVFDVTGAGDTVVAVFTLALAAGLNLATAAKLSNVAGGVVVGEIGCVAVTEDQLKNAIRVKNENYFSRS